MSRRLRKFFIFLTAAFVAGTAGTAFGVVQISNMNTFAFGSWSGSGNLVATDGICIYDNATPATYQLRFRGSGGGSAFTIANGATTIPYTVEYQASGAPFVGVIANTTTTYNTANGVSATCAGGTNGNVRITFTAANLSLVRAATYTGILTIRLQP